MAGHSYRLHDGRRLGEFVDALAVSYNRLPGVQGACTVFTGLVIENPALSALPVL